MKTYNIAFFGTSDRSVPILERLKEHPLLNLALVITKDDVKVGRKQQLKETEVKTWAKDNGIKYFTTKSVRNDSKLIIEQLLSSNIDAGVVADFSFIIPEEIINTPAHGLVNVHFSLLPRWRGASPVQFALLHGDKTTGITYHLVSKDMDRGNIIKHIEYNIAEGITSGELYNEMFVLAADNLPDILLSYLKGEIDPLPQKEEEATYTYSPTNPTSTFIFKEDAQIEWNKTPHEIYRAIVAFNPWPIAWTDLEELEQAIKVNIRENKDKKLKVKIYEASLGSNGLNIEKLQIEGGKVLSWKEFLNGYTN